jgi:TrpR-related protein YerC/YecD
MLNGGIAMKRTESMDRLFRTMLNLESIDECYAYFEDLCTIKELNDMSQRLDAAILLADGLSYQKIMDQVAISTATIGRVSRCLNYGTGGYRSAINKLKED